MSMSRFGKKPGFSIIEVLVVAAIVGVLAAISVPMYIGYVRAQRQSTVSNLAETAAAAANAYYRRTGLEPPNGTQNPNNAPLQLYFSNALYRVSIDNGTAHSVTASTADGSVSNTLTYR